MTESVSVETQPAHEIPQRTTSVELPFVSIPDSLLQIRLGMHTDTIGIFLRTLHALPNVDQLRVETRDLTPEQEKLLLMHPVYEFYLKSRINRAGVIFPTSLRLSEDNVSMLAQSAFTPSALSDELGFTTKYVSAASLVQDWENGKTPNDFLTILGGLNMFSIGSDTLSQEDLENAKREIDNAFRREESVAGIIQALANTTFTQVPFQDLKKVNIFPTPDPTIISKISREITFTPSNNTSFIKELIHKKNV